VFFLGGFIVPTGRRVEFRDPPASSAADINPAAVTIDFFRKFRLFACIENLIFTQFIYYFLELAPCSICHGTMTYDNLPIFETFHLRVSF
jgi:hypothetical protein